MSTLNIPLPSKKWKFSAWSVENLEQLTTSIQKSMKITKNIKTTCQNLTGSLLTDEKKENITSHIDDVHVALKVLLDSMENAVATISPVSKQPTESLDFTSLLASVPPKDSLRLTFYPQCTTKINIGKNGLEEGPDLLPTETASDPDGIVKGLVDELIERVVLSESMESNVDSGLPELTTGSEQKVLLCQIHFSFFFTAVKDIDKGLKILDSALFYPVMSEFYNFRKTKKLTGYATFTSLHARKFLRAQQKDPHIDEQCYIILCELEVMLEDKKFGSLVRELVVFAHYSRNRGRCIIHEWGHHIADWLMAHWMCAIHMYLEFHEVRIDGLQEMLEDQMKYVWKHDFTRVSDLEFFKNRLRETKVTMATTREALLKEWFYGMLEGVTNRRRCDILDIDFDFITTRSPELVEKVELQVLFHMFGVKNGRIDF